MYFTIVIITILLLSKSKILSCRVSMAIDTIFSVYILYTKPIGVLDEEELAYFKKKIEKRINFKRPETKKKSLT